MTSATSADVVIVGGGLAGLCLARQLLLETDKTVLVLERRPKLPPKRQKVGESSVQIGGYYLSKVLDLEEHLWCNHFLKYNLRFHWPSRGRENRDYEDYSQGTIRNLSNIASYQVDRNVLEGELLRLVRADPRCTVRLGTKVLGVELGKGPTACHTVRYAGEYGDATATADWVVDASGRAGLMARKRAMRRPSPIVHGSFFWWVDGLVDVERMTGRSRREVRLAKERRRAGHLPAWLATNHFCDEGLWFWIIPLQGKTSLGIVFDKAVVDHREVFSVEKATRWICDRFPVLAHDLPHREVLDFAGFTDYAYDCTETISAERWALTGESGRFSDPLYSPGNDLIAIHNTLIVDAVKTEDPAERDAKCRRYEQLARAVYQAYVPSYGTSYDALGDPETLTLKYTWELTVYFAGYVFPFINDLFTDRRFLIHFMRLFMRLGPINHAMQKLLSGFYRWKKAQGRVGLAAPIYFDFTDIEPLRRAQGTFLEVGLDTDQAKQVLARQVAGLEELARFMVAHVAAVVLDEPRVRTSRGFVAAIDLDGVDFDPETWSELWHRVKRDDEIHTWSFDPTVLAPFAPDAMPVAAAHHDAAADEGEPQAVLTT